MIIYPNFAKVHRRDWKGTIVLIVLVLELVEVPLRMYKLTASTTRSVGAARICKN